MSEEKKLFVTDGNQTYPVLQYNGTRVYVKRPDQCNYWLTIGEDCEWYNPEIERLKAEVAELKSIVDDLYPLALAFADRQKFGEDMHPVHQKMLDKAAKICFPD